MIKGSVTSPTWGVHRVEPDDVAKRERTNPPRSLLSTVLMVLLALVALGPASTAGTFTDTGAALTGVTTCSLAWGDYDNDGDLDLAVAGSGASAVITKLYRNDGGSFVDTDAALTGVTTCSLAWGDYDNDGDLDLAVAGSGASAVITKIYRNDGGSFVDAGAGLTGVSNCSLAWGDYDNDGDLDLAVAGQWGAYHQTKLYRNDSGTVNAVPTAPGGLTASASGSSVTLGWSAATDAETSSAGLSYNIRIGTSPGSGNIFSGLADWSTGLRKLPALGNAQKKLSWSIGGITPGGTYYCSVQTIDTAFAGSPWATEVIAGADTVDPDIESVVASPSMCARGDLVHVTVVATDDIGVTEVAANGVSLAYQGSDTWTGNLTAPTTLGSYSVTVVVRDAAGNLDTDTTGIYKVGPVVAANCRASRDPVMVDACQRHLFKFFGIASDAGTNTFRLDDGSGETIEVSAPGYAGVSNGDYAAARGVFDPVLLKLICQPEHVDKLH